MGAAHRHLALVTTGGRGVQCRRLQLLAFPHSQSIDVMNTIVVNSAGFGGPGLDARRVGFQVGLHRPSEPPVAVDARHGSFPARHPGPGGSR